MIRGGMNDVISNIMSQAKKKSKIKVVPIEFKKAILETKQINNNGIYLKVTEKIENLLRNTDFIDDLYKGKYLNNWEYKFLIDTSHCKQLTEKQRARFQIILTKLKKYVQHQ